MSDEFIEHMKRVDPSTWSSDLLRVGDELGTAEAIRQSTKFRYRHARARYTSVLMWWLAQRQMRAGMLGNEVTDMMTTRLAPKSDNTSFAITSAIIHVVCDLVLRWPIAALTEVNHASTGTAADSELLRLAQRDKLAIITNEELTETGIIPSPKKLRSRARAAGVEVYTPQEFLAANNVDVTVESERFIERLRDAVVDAKARNVLGGNAVLDELVPLYRTILLDEVDGSIAHIVPPPMP